MLYLQSRSSNSILTGECKIESNPIVNASELRLPCINPSIWRRWSNSAKSCDICFQKIKNPTQTNAVVIVLLTDVELFFKYTSLYPCHLEPHLTAKLGFLTTQIAKFVGTTWGPPGSCRPQLGPCWPHEPCNQGTLLFSIQYSNEAFVSPTIYCFW